MSAIGEAGSEATINSLFGIHVSPRFGDNFIHIKLGTVSL